MQRQTRSLAISLVAAMLAAACGSTVAIDGGVPAGNPAAVGPSATEAGSEDDGLAFAPPPSTSPSNATGLSTATGTGTGTAGSSPGTSSSLPDSSGAQPPAAGAQPPAAGAQPPAGGDQPGGEQPAQPGEPAQPGQPAPPAEQAPPEGGPARGGTTAPGITDDEIVIGIAIQDQNDPGNEELLGVPITQGDPERYYEIVRDEINANGGIAGRQIRYSIFRFSTAGGAQLSQLEGQACEYWARDDRAFVVNALTTSPNFLGCAKDNGLVSVGSGITASDARTFVEFPTHVEASAMDLNRVQPNMVAGLDAQGYFGPRPGQVVAPGEEAYTLGVVVWDDPRFIRALEGSLIPALEARGVALDPNNIARIKRAESNEDLAEISSQIQAAVLRFRSQGVTNVVFVEDAGLLWLLFARSAENQGYRPRYGTTSHSGNTTIGAIIAGNAPEQLRDAVGIGWVPAFDVPPEERPLTGASQACFDLMEREGAPANSDNPKAIQLSVCEFVNLTKTAVEAGLPDITPQSFIAGVNALGTSFPSYGSLETNAFGPDRHAGAHLYRTVAWDPDCVCFHYTSDAVSDLRRR